MKPDNWKSMSKPERKLWRRERRRARRKAMASAIDRLAPIAEEAVEEAAAVAGMDGELRSDVAVGIAVRALDAALVFPEPFETLSDLAIKGLVPLVRGFVERAYQRRKAKLDGEVP